MKAFSLAVAFLLALSACSEKEPDKGNNRKFNRAPVLWDRVPGHMNPEILESNISTRGLGSLNFDLFGFDYDFKVIYTNSLSSNEAKLKRYTVHSNNAKEIISDVESLEDKSLGRLEIFNTGEYKCSIGFIGGYINYLRGSCYVRVELLLPTGSEIEIYNLGKKIN